MKSETKREELRMYMGSDKIIWNYVGSPLVGWKNETGIGLTIKFLGTLVHSMNWVLKLLTYITPVSHLFPESENEKFYS